MALSARCARLGRRMHRSAHIICSRALSLCVVLQSLRRSHASQVESISASKSAHARGAGGEEEKRERHDEAGNRDGTRNACRILLLHSSTCVNGFYSCGLVKTERRRGRAVCLPLLRCLHREQHEHAPVQWPPQLCLLRGHASRRVFLTGVRPARRQLCRQAQRPAIPGGSAAQPPLRQGGAGGQGQLAACSAGLSRRRDLQQ